MANSDKNVLITPNIGSSTDEPKIQITGADASGSDTITIAGSYDGTSSSLSFEGSAGQLFSVSNIDSDGNGYLFTVNDKSGIPSLQVETDGTVILNPNVGNVLIGSSTDDGSNKLQITGDVIITGNFSVDGNQAFADNEFLTFGNSNDLQIYHDGLNSYISEVGTGGLVIQARDFITIEDGTSGENYIYMQRDNKVELYYDGSAKLATTSTGIDVTGEVKLDNRVLFAGGTEDTIVLTDYAIRAASTGLHIDTPTSHFVNIDTNNNGTGAVFAVRSNSGTSNLFSVDESGNGIFSGQLTVNGTLTTINTTDLSITDNIIVLNKDEAGAGVGGGTGTSGIEVERGTSSNVQWVFDDNGDYWRPSSGIGIHTTGDLTQTSAAPTFKQTETGVTNTPVWWLVSDGGNWSIRLNNTGNYPIHIRTNTANNAITTIDLAYDTKIIGTITAGDTSGTAGEVILQANYGDGNIATWGSMRSSGGPFMGYGVSSSTTTGNTFISTSAVASLERAAYQLDGNDHRWYCAAAQTTAVGNNITSMNQVMSLDTNGDLSVQGDGTFVGDVVTNFSDQRLKNIDSKVADAVTKVKALNGYLYTYNDKAREVGYQGDNKHIGVIAQEVQAVVPEAVTLAPFDRDSHDKTKSVSGEDYLTVKYERLVPLLIEAIKEQAATIEVLEERINKLEKA